MCGKAPVISAAAPASVHRYGDQYYFLYLHRVESPVARVVVRVLLVPVIAGVAYEFIRLTGRSNNIVMRILSLPGKGMQMLTTKEPDDDMIEVAIAAVEAVFDWRAFQGLKEEEPLMCRSWNRICQLESADRRTGTGRAG